MPTRSIEKVATGLMLLRDGLGPYVEREINNALRTGRLAKADLAKHANDPDLFDRRISDWDVSPLLRVMFAVWNDAFRELLGPAERSLVSELRNWRNRWAHQDRLTDDDADRILDSVERLLTAVGASEAKRAKAIKDELRKERYAATPPAPAAAPPPNPAPATASAPTAPPKPRVRVMLPPDAPAPPVVEREVGAPRRGVAKRAALRASEPAPERRAAKRPAERTTAKKAATSSPAAKKTTAKKSTAKKSTAGKAATGNSTAASSTASSSVAERAFKVVCWMKPEEAEVVAQAYATQQAARTTTGLGTEVEAVWYGPDHPDAITYRAEVCMLRHRRSGDPRRMWIREEEALAVLAAYESAATVEYEHAQHGSGGRAVHHPDDAPEVRKYLANVMLTRFR